MTGILMTGDSHLLNPPNGNLGVHLTQDNEKSTGNFDSREFTLERLIRGHEKVMTGYFDDR